MLIQGMSFSTIQTIIKHLPKPHYMDVTIHGSFNIYTPEEDGKSLVKSEKTSSKREVNQGSKWYRNEKVTKHDVLNEFHLLLSGQEPSTLAAYWRNIDGCADIGLTPYCVTIYRRAKTISIDHKTNFNAEEQRCENQHHTVTAH